MQRPLLRSPAVTSPATQPAAPARLAGARLVRGAKALDPQQRLVYALWFIQLCAPHFMLAKDFGLTPMLRLPLVLIGCLVVSMLLAPQKGDWLIGPLMWVVMMAVTLPFAGNLEKAIPAFRLVISYYIVALGVMRAIRTPREAGQIIFMTCVGQFLWWGVLGLKDGAVPWHPTLANQDAFGPAMTIGVGPAYFYATACPPGWRRKLALATAAICVGGVISSFARGAVLCLLAVVAYIWYRSPKKGRAFGFIAGTALVASLAGIVVDGKTRDPTSQSNIIDEVMTSFNANDPTGNDRKAIWAVARTVFFANPLFGAGTESFGAGALKLYQEGRLGAVAGAYSENPATLYDRAIHNLYYQILSEDGLVGVTIFLFILVQFWKKCRALMDPRAVAIWKAAGGVEDIGKVALGMECGMVGFLSTGYFYNQLWDGWLWFLVFTNALMYWIVFRRLTTSGPARRTRPTVGLQPAPIG
jgi:putative inorganic carbon (hco3(-)) transporter